MTFVAKQKYLLPRGCHELVQPMQKLLFFLFIKKLQITHHSYGIKNKDYLNHVRFFTTTLFLYDKQFVK